MIFLAVFCNLISVLKIQEKEQIGAKRFVLKCNCRKQLKISYLIARSSEYNPLPNLGSACGLNMNNLLWIKQNPEFYTDFKSNREKVQQKVLKHKKSFAMENWGGFVGVKRNVCNSEDSHLLLKMRIFLQINMLFWCKTACLSVCRCPSSIYRRCESSYK